MAEQHIENVCEDRARKGDGSFAIAFAILQLARAQERTATALNRLGFNGAIEKMGGLEAVAHEMRKAGEAIADALQDAR
ncbi:hypothetical protein [Sphingomonas sanxanigenens]|uniref:Uncharacterized protein n=1 Tax=Sphingomonas sanxanigenens DSM 19645 = NX02 TaxID=1123269 RepID=W0AJM9_9SPHN|nr:hypothetical protein [Sphingomonas sanxanigenens]AHE55880.1 hypothetical protein NX02_21220 [Sphingomonas sanxanigenens DSM 19645 = NX02]